MRKIFLLAAFSVLLLSVRSQAQVFTLDQTLTSGNTLGYNGNPYSGWDDYALELINHVNNLSQTNPITDLRWEIVQNLDNTTNPGWFVYSFCDNITCDVAPNIPNGRLFAPIPEKGRSDFKMKIAVPNTAPTGMVGVVKVRVYNNLQDDTAIYVATKAVTGVNLIKMTDNRVSLYPNPSTNGQVNLFANNSLNARAVTIYNVLGARVATHQLGGEVSVIDVANYAAGTYFFTLVDANGAIITSRKFIKM